MECLTQRECTPDILTMPKIKVPISFPSVAYECHLLQLCQFSLFGQFNKCKIGFTCFKIYFITRILELFWCLMVIWVSFANSDFVFFYWGIIMTFDTITFISNRQWLRVIGICPFMCMGMIVGHIDNTCEYCRAGISD
jgi:hypothetical protein